ncbi:aminoglycoside phosphotransferase family protein [Aureibaculum sp. 2210JD6-5]|uniref:phosphotransferase enzyme family protein n=1 Tax=Aureibaculum sp. 2210JD6-5 TaxID=3103957 RepID=UPI002AAD932A|nr:aminoglycoside phosphotransferase family protein [Aureibaculum sp. 2210JD6-5]MDY7397034.1 aminoglycoside phosphotransferase family protein [Aureibaculum sp. 2210JD6-5]
MLEEKLKKVFNQFQHNGEFRSFKELASGHINDTYLVITSKKPFFVLQRINQGVFKDVPGLIENKVAVSHHIREKLKELPPKKLKRRVLAFAKTKSDGNYHKDQDGNYWNLMYFIGKSVTHEIVTSEEIAYEGGRLLGQFLTFTSDFDASKLVEVIPKFHDMSFRYEQFEEALKIASMERLERAKDYIKLVADLKEEMHIIQNLKESGEIKLRVTHNDTKISNALFNKKNKGLCLIDTDTVMPGVVHYDFGDAIRTICNTAAEDETNLDLVEFNFDYYKAYSKGFLKKMKSSLSPIELRCLPLGAKTMIFIMALRFLTDYLNGDIYYKTKYPEHNLNRAKNQFKLIDSFMENYYEII